jgi:hypothetical protein
VPLGPVGVCPHDRRTRGENLQPEWPRYREWPGAAAIWSEVLSKKIKYAGHDMDAFEKQMRDKSPAWSAFDIRMMFQGYIERGFVAGDDDIETLTTLLGHAPRRYIDLPARWLSHAKSKFVASGVPAAA